MPHVFVLPLTIILYAIAIVIAFPFIVAGLMFLLSLFTVIIGAVLNIADKIGDDYRANKRKKSISIK